MMMMKWPFWYIRQVSPTLFFCPVCSQGGRTMVPVCIFSLASANIFCCSATASASDSPEVLVHLLLLRGDSWEGISPRFKVSVDAGTARVD